MNKFGCATIMTAVTLWVVVKTKREEVGGVGALSQRSGCRPSSTCTGCTTCPCSPCRGPCGTCGFQSVPSGEVASFLVRQTGSWGSDAWIFGAKPAQEKKDAPLSRSGADRSLQTWLSFGSEALFYKQSCACSMLFFSTKHLILTPIYGGQSHSSAKVTTAVY